MKYEMRIRVKDEDGMKYEGWAEIDGDGQPVGAIELDDACNTCGSFEVSITGPHLLCSKCGVKADAEKKP